MQAGRFSAALLWTDGPRIMPIPDAVLDEYTARLWDLDARSLDASGGHSYLPRSKRCRYAAAVPGIQRRTNTWPNAVSDNDLRAEVLKSTEPVLVDFFAEWCGPCKAMAPALEQVATEMKGKVKVVKLDVDQNPDRHRQVRHPAMPTLMIFKDGQVAAQHVGALVQKKKLEDWINSSVA